MLMRTRRACSISVFREQSKETKAVNSTWTEEGLDTPPVRSRCDATSYMTHAHDHPRDDEHRYWNGNTFLLAAFASMAFVQKIVRLTSGTVCRSVHGAYTQVCDQIGLCGLVDGRRKPTWNRHNHAPGWTT